MQKERKCDEDVENSLSSNRRVVERRLKRFLQAIDNLVSSGKAEDSLMLS